MKHITEMGYEAIDTLGGIDIYDGDLLMCSLPGTLSRFEGDDGNINDDALEDAINEQLIVDRFLDDQCNYM